MSEEAKSKELWEVIQDAWHKSTARNPGAWQAAAAAAREHIAAEQRAAREEQAQAAGSEPWRGERLRAEGSEFFADLYLGDKFVASVVRVGWSVSLADEIATRWNVGWVGDEAVRRLGEEQGRAEELERRAEALDQCNARQAETISEFRRERDAARSELTAERALRGELERRLAERIVRQANELDELRAAWGQQEISIGELQAKILGVDQHAAEADAKVDNLEWRLEDYQEAIASYRKRYDGWVEDREKADRLQASLRRVKAEVDEALE